MTESEAAAETARLLAEYSGLIRKKTCLEAAIQAHADPLGILVTHLRRDPLKVRARDGGFVVVRSGDEVSVKPDFKVLAARVEALHETTRRLNDVCSMLKNTEHAHMVAD